MGRMGLVGHPGRSGEARNRGPPPPAPDDRTRAPTTAPGLRRPHPAAEGGRVRSRKGLAAQGPDCPLIGVTPPGTVLLPYSDNRKARPP